MNTRLLVWTALFAFAAATLSPLTAAAAQPDKHHRPPAPPHPGHHWNDGRWDHGYWHHGWYASRFGWWWVVGPSWYYYSVPAYPYGYSRRPSDVVVVEQPAPSGPPPTAYWYWCDDPRGYYPYVAQCAGDWTPVPATPPAAPQP
ncbi:MAG: hypothetical protein WC809_19180 [Sinimarinibacterium sp.]